MLHDSRITLSLCVCITVLILQNYGEQNKSQSYERIKIVKDKKNNNQKFNQQSRPQEPKPPYPYEEEEVSCESDDVEITLAGTLTTPYGAGPFPAVLLISGMGPNDRNGMSKLYFVLADYLTRQGIAVLRMDKRGVGKSTGMFNPSVTTQDLTNDAFACINYLKSRKDINHAQIGLIGHSEGGLIASMIAAQSTDVAFVVLMAGAVNNTQEGMLEQTAIQLRADGASHEMIVDNSKILEKIIFIVKGESNPEMADRLLKNAVSEYFETLSELLKLELENYLFAVSPRNAESKIALYNSPWYRWYLACDAMNVLNKIHVPLLALYGEYDFMAPALMFPIIHKAMQEAGNCEYETITLPKLNHSFQTCKTGAIAEYATIEEIMAPVAMKTIADWILMKINKTV